MRLLSAIAIVAVLAFGLGACSSHNAKNVYACPNKGPGVGFKAVKSGKLTVQTSLPAAGWWTGTTQDTLTGGYEFTLAKDLCAALGIGKVRIVDVPLNTLVAGKTTDFDVAIAHVAITPALQNSVDVSTGYFTTTSGTQYGMLLPKGSTNTKLVNTAIATLKSKGTLAALAKSAPSS